MLNVGETCEQVVIKDFLQLLSSIVTKVCLSAVWGKDKIKFINKIVDNLLFVESKIV